jgi:hypothetical protein
MVKRETANVKTAASFKLHAASKYSQKLKAESEYSTGIW